MQKLKIKHDKNFVIYFLAHKGLDLELLRVTPISYKRDVKRNNQIAQDKLNELQGLLRKVA